MRSLFSPCCLSRDESCRRKRGLDAGGSVEKNGIDREEEKKGKRGAEVSKRGVKRMLFFGCLFLESKKPKLSKPLELSRLKDATGTFKLSLVKVCCILDYEIEGWGILCRSCSFSTHTKTSPTLSSQFTREEGGKLWPLLEGLRMQDYAVKPARNS